MTILLPEWKVVLPNATTSAEEDANMQSVFDQALSLILPGRVIATVCCERSAAPLPLGLLSLPCCRRAGGTGAGHIPL